MSVFIAKELSEVLNTRLTIGKINIGLLNRIIIDDVLLDDQSGKEMLKVNACKAKAEELGKKNGWLLYPLGIALSGKQRTPGGGTDLACMMGREKTVERVKAAIEKLNG